MNWKKKELVWFLGFGRGAIFIDKTNGHWYSEKNGVIKCNIAIAVWHHHDISFSEFKEKIKTVCSVQHGKKHQPKHDPHEVPSRQVMEYVLFRGKARISQLKKPWWKGKKVVANTYKEGSCDGIEH